MKRTEKSSANSRLRRADPQRVKRATPTASNVDDTSGDARKQRCVPSRDQVPHSPGFSSSQCSPSQPSSGRGRRISRTLHRSHTPRELRLVFELHGALLTPCTRNLAWHVYDLLQSWFRDQLLRNHLDEQPSPPSSVAQGYPRPLTLRLWSLRCPLDRLYHWYLSLRPSCQNGWYLALHHNCCVHSLVSVLDLWELLLLVRITSFCITADTSAILPM